MWNLPSSDFVLHWLSMIALAAQAMTAALVAGRRSMDWAGVAMLGCITALGGGTIRDVLLGHYPLVWVERPWLLGLISIAALLTIPIARLVHRLYAAFLVPEEIGTNNDEPVRGVPIGDTAHILIYTKDFLQEDSAWAISASWRCEVCVELAAVE